MQRQGDVLIIPVGEIPKKGYRKAKDLVLAEGEVTGHLHEVQGEAQLFRSEDIQEIEDMFLAVEHDALTKEPIYETRKTGRMVPEQSYTEVDELTGHITTETVPAHEETERVKIGERKVPGVSVTHPEHDTLTLPPGNYKVLRQRQFVAGDAMQVGD